jgi:S-adenosylmethionine-dependent methyltransferase
MKTSAQTDNRFQRDAGKYAAYLDTPEGRLRLDLAFANVQEFLRARQANHSLSALDLGCGTGAAAVRLAQLGFHVTLLDSSPAMLDIAERAAIDAGVIDKTVRKQGDAAQVASLFHRGSFDLILCHNLLEYVDDPGAVLRGAACVMRDSSAILSILVRNQAGEVLKAALQAGDLAAAEHNLAAEWGQESLYGGKVRLFTPEALDAMLKGASLTLSARRGVRVITDYLPAQIPRSTEYERIFALERKLGSRDEFAAAARYTHLLARRVPENKDRA